MTWWLNVFFMINGVWLPGAAFDGWAPRPYASAEICEERRAFAQAHCEENMPYETLWICSAGTPMEEPPPGMRGIPC